jgi:2-polyprenyl-3-methyl-5-hydroxy-6-metoxy-1,4-benzoquinol methylase
MEPSDLVMPMKSHRNTHPDLSRREIVGEVMDDPALPEEEHALALAGLRRINRLSRTAAHLAMHLRKLLVEDRDRPRRILDVACGDGDNTLALAERLNGSGLPWQVEGCDISSRAVAFAQANASARGLDTTFFQADALKDLDVQGYDAVVNSLFLHHLEDDQIVSLLHQLKRARHLIVSDLVRGRFAYEATRLGVHLLSRSRVVHIDGPLSVRAALTQPELLRLATRAGLSGAQLRSCWPMRQLLTWSQS